MSVSLHSQLIQGPFLRRVGGEELMLLMKEIRSAEKTGEMECLADAGAAFMLHFELGLPLADKAEIKEALTHNDLTVAWMPGKKRRSRQEVAKDNAKEKEAASKAKLDGETTADNIAINLSRVVNEIQLALWSISDVYLEEGEWVAIFAGPDLVATSSDQATQYGLGRFAGLVAEANGMISGMLEDDDIQEVYAVFPKTRLGFETISNEWGVMYCIRRANRNILDAVKTSVMQHLKRFRLLEGGDGRVMRTPGYEGSVTQYMYMRPDAYRRAEQGVRFALKNSRVPWRHCWFRVGDGLFAKVEPNEPDFVQEVDGLPDKLSALISSGVGQVDGHPPRALILRTKHHSMIGEPLPGDSFMLLDMRDDSLPSMAVLQQLRADMRMILDAEF